MVGRRTAYLILSCGMALSGTNGALQYPLEAVLKMLARQPYDFERSWTEPSAFKNQITVVRMQPRQQRP